MNGARCRMLAFVSLIVALMLPTIVASARNSDAPDRVREQKILSRMHRITQFEIEMGEMAMRRGRTQEVRDFGRTLRNAHQEIDRKVAAVARKEGLSLTIAAPTRTDERMTDHERQMRRRLESADDAAFDRAFLEAMAKGHGLAAQLLKRARSRLEKGRVRALVTSTLPAIERHRRLAEELQSRV